MYKQDVLKIIRDRIEELNKSLSYGLAVTDVHQIVASKKELRKVMEAVSALPEQGAVLLETLMTDSQGERYTKDQIEKSFNAGASAWELCYGMQDEVGFEEMKTKFLSSLTPVAVEAERTERWIAIADKTPDERHNVMWMKFPVTEPGYYGTFIDENFPGMEYFTHWMRLDHLWPDGELPKDSLAPQVNNNKTK